MSTITWEQEFVNRLPIAKQNVTRIVEYVQAVGAWFDENPGAVIDALLSYVNPSTCPIAYLGFLAENIGLVLNTKNTTEVQQRKQVFNAVAWYKVRGTYTALRIVMYMNGLRANIYDWWTEDYATFTRIAAGDNTDRSPLYKSPHFELEIILGTVYGEYPNQYLLIANVFENVLSGVEEVRGINNVPHYSARLDAACKSNEQVSGITSRQTITEAFTVGSESVSAGVYRRDDGKLRDDSLNRDHEANDFYNSLTGFKVGTGRPNTDPASTDLDLASPVYSGSVDSITITASSVTIMFSLPEGVSFSGLTEFGVFNAAHTIMYVSGTNPIIDKSSDIIVRYSVTINLV